MKNALEINNLYKNYRRGSTLRYFTFREAVSLVLKSTLRTKSNLKKSQFWALKDVSFKVKPGEVLGIIGPNGAGKSTLLKIISKITYPTKGYVKLNGKVGSLLEVGTGFHQELTGKENIFLNGAILGMSKEEIKGKFKQIVEFSGVEEFINTPVKRYSSGMQIRLAFAVAAHLDPEILLVDEVLSVGDAEFQKKSLGKMEEVSRKSKRTILFVSHNLAAVRKLCSRCLYLRDGAIIVDGETQSVIDKYLGSVSRSSTQLIKRKDRSGDGKVVLSGFTLRDNKKRKVAAFVSGKDSYIDLHIKRNTSQIKSLDITIQFIDREGSLICTLGNKLTDQQLDTKKTTFVCKIPRLPLTRGEYYLNVVIKVNQDISDSMDNSFSIKVISEDYFDNSLSYENYGKVFIDHYWK